MKQETKKSEERTEKEHLKLSSKEESSSSVAIDFQQVLEKYQQREINIGKVVEVIREVPASGCVVERTITREPTTIVERATSEVHSAESASSAAATKTDQEVERQIETRTVVEEVEVLVPMSVETSNWGLGVDYSVLGQRLAGVELSRRVFRNFQVYGRGTYALESKGFGASAGIRWEF